MKKAYLQYNKKLKQISINLRNNSTISEVLLWNELKAGKFHGFKFNRQKPLGNYVVDFYCKKLNLALEIDGESHIGKQYLDTKRQNELEKLGINFLRFDDLEIKFDVTLALRKIERYIEDHR